MHLNLLKKKKTDIVLTFNESLFCVNHVEAWEHYDNEDYIKLEKKTKTQ